MGDRRAGLTDATGLPMSTAPARESGKGDPEFYADAGFMTSVASAARAHGRDSFAVRTAPGVTRRPASPPPFAAPEELAQ